MPNFIASGTVNVTAGQTLVTFEDVLLPEARDGDTLELYGVNKGRYTLASIGGDLVSAQLSVPFDGVTQAGAPYTVRYDSLQRVPPLELADQLRRLRDQVRIFERTAPLYRVQSLGANAPPGAPVAGDMYVVGTVPTGAWAGQAGNLTQWTGAVWQFTTAEAGWMAYSVATGMIYFRGTSAWLPFIAPSAYIQTLMDDVDAATARTTLGLADVLRFGAQTLTDPQKAQARANIGLDKAARTLWTADISTPVAAINIPLEAGYRDYKLICGWLAGSDSSATIYHRVSLNGSTLDVGASDYNTAQIIGGASVTGGAAFVGSYGIIGTMVASQLVLDIDPGEATSSYMATASSLEFQGGYRAALRGMRRMVAGRAQFIQVGVLAGTLSAGCKFTLIGYP